MIVQQRSAAVFSHPRLSRDANLLESLAFRSVLVPSGGDLVDAVQRNSSATGAGERILHAYSTQVPWGVNGYVSPA